MYLSTSVNKPFTQQVSEARPLSHLAAFTLLGTSIFMVHSGAETALADAPQLVTATTAAIVAIEFLQWTALGRIAKLTTAREHSRASVLKWQSAGIGIFQVILYTLAIVGYAAKGGADWTSGVALYGAIALAALFAGISFVSKWTSCEPVATAADASASGPTGGTRAPIDAAIFGDRASPATKPGNVAELKQRVARHAEERPFRPGAKPATASNAGRDLALKRWKTA